MSYQLARLPSAERCRLTVLQHALKEASDDLPSSGPKKEEHEVVQVLREFLLNGDFGCAGSVDTGGTSDEGLPASKLADAALLLHPWQRSVARYALHSWRFTRQPHQL